MRILFLSHYFPPEVNAPASRAYEHSKRWVQAGHDVTVVACVPHHPMGKVYPGYTNRLYRSEMRDGIRLVHVLTYVTPNEGFVKRSLNYILYMIMVVIIAPFLPKTDVVLSTSPQFFNGLAGYFVGRIKRAPWVLEIRDLWPESILAVGAIKNRHLISLVESLESFVYRKADRIVIVSEAFGDHIAARGGRPDKISVIMNGVDFDLFGRSEPGNEALQSLRLENRFVAAYVGTHGMAHGLETILDAARRLKSHEDIVFLLVGDGAEKQNLDRQRTKMNLDNVIMLEQQPKAMMPAIWSLVDVSLVVLRDLDLFRSVLPSKIFESMAMGVPIILGVRGESQRLVEQAQAGVCFEPENPEQLAEAVLRIYESKENARAMGANGKCFVKAHFDRNKLAEKYVSILASVARTS